MTSIINPPLAAPPSRAAAPTSFVVDMDTWLAALAVAFNQLNTANGIYAAGEDVDIDNGTFFVDVGTNNVGIGTLTPSVKFDVETSGFAVEFNNTNAAAAEQVMRLLCSRTASSAYSFVTAYSDAGGSVDLEYHVRGDGEVSADGSFTGGGADYAEFFEWLDGNPDDEDRRGVAVVLEAGKIRPALESEDPLGVVSATPSVVGDGDMGRWKGKYLRDAFNCYLMEDYQVVAWNDVVKTEGKPDKKIPRSHAADQVPAGVKIPADAKYSTLRRRKLNPDFDPELSYTPRADRPEWGVVGLMGKLRIYKGQPVGARWIKMRDIDDSIEEWLVR